MHGIERQISRIERSFSLYDVWWLKTNLPKPPFIKRGLIYSPLTKGDAEGWGIWQKLGDDFIEAFMQFFKISVIIDYIIGHFDAGVDILFIRIWILTF